ncbi:hypothetical protein ROA7450_03292 [Roseovarius albus]|uniref:Beta-barrel assembly machine subunit BamF n=1 Tax=Roseovarius albus TaxID=1247867 RepID=A0A1X6ZVS7_9RHOB|nr:DUF3035 domain-containing protein [Roseovarius albus]SLN63066.1 hypothetical protein ROA7450_03292 [Roseovarius albus]
MAMPRVVMMAMVLTAVAACSGKDKPLTRIKHTGNGPDEFAILPSKPLQEPESFTSLPAPAPGTANLTDVNPRAEGVIALGGNPAALAGNKINASETALVNYSRRYGVEPDIRTIVAVEDAEVRKKRGRVNILNIGPDDDYTLAYKKEWLNSQAAREQLSAQGVGTPSAPPGE